MNDWQVSEVRFTSVPVWDGDGVFFDYLKYNENHDELGRFAEGETSGRTSYNVNGGNGFVPPNLPSAQQQAIARYTGKNSSDINNYLRFGTKPVDKAEVSKDIATLDSVLAQNPTTADTTVWRGISRDMIKTLGRAVDKGQGIFVDKGFTSTTRNQRFGSIRDVGYVSIDLPKGSPALDVEPWSFKPEERETLIARGQTYAARRDSADPNHFFLRLVPNVGKASMLLIKRREADRKHADDRFTWDANHVVFLAKKYNPNHDDLGRFAEGPGGGVGDTGPPLPGLAGPNDKPQSILDVKPPVKPATDLPATGYAVAPVVDESTGTKEFLVTFNGKAVNTFNDEALANTYMHEQSTAYPGGSTKLTSEDLPLAYDVKPAAGGTYEVQTGGVVLASGDNMQQAVQNFAIDHPDVMLPPGYELKTDLSSAWEHQVVGPDGTTVAYGHTVTDALVNAKQQSLLSVQATSQPSSTTGGSPVVGGVKLTGELLPAGYTVEPGKPDEGGFNVVNTEGWSVTHGSSGQQAVTNYFNSHPNAALPEDFKFVSGNILDDKGNVVFTQIDPSQKPSQVVEEFLNSPKMSANFGTSGTGYYISNAGVQVHVPGAAASTAAFVKPTLGDDLVNAQALLPEGHALLTDSGGKWVVYDTAGNPVHTGVPGATATETAKEYLNLTKPQPTSSLYTTPFVPGEEHLPEGVQLKANQSGYSPFKVVSATGEVLGAGDTQEEALHDYFVYHANTLLPAGYQVGYDHIADTPTILDQNGKEVYSGKAGQSGYTGVLNYLTANPSLIGGVGAKDVASLATLPESMRFGTGAGGGPEALGTAGLPPGFNHPGEETLAPGEVAPPSVHTMQADEKQAIYSYTGSGNGPLNKYLRDGITPNNPGNVSDSMKLLDQIFADTSTAKAMTLFRGISANAQAKLDYAIEHTDGHFVDPGFVSTSDSRSTAMSWKDGTYVTIDLPAGSKAFKVGNMSAHPGEGEWILARDQHFTVRKDTSNQNYMGDHYFLTLMNRSPAPKETRQIELPFVDHGPVNKQEEPYDPNEKFIWDESGIVPTDPAELEKFNPWHDLMGLFTSGPSGGASVGEHGTTGSTAASTTTVNEMLAPHITPEQRDSVAYYTDEGYLGINQYLRYGKEPPSSNTPFFSDNSGVEEAQSTIQHLDEILAHSSLPQETTVFRGLSPRAADRMDAALAAGDSRFVDKGFISTTASEHYAEVFAQRMMQNHAIAEIVLPKGSHARDVSSWSSSPDERETLVARGSAFKVERVERLPSGPRYHLRLLPEYSPNQLDLPLGKSMNTGDKYTWNGDEMEFFAEKFNPNHDELGRFASGPGGGLEGYSADSKLVDGKLHTSNIDDALKALAANREVVLDQPHQVSTLLDRLAAMAKDAAAKGEKAPKYDLCNVSVSGTNLFCGGSLGIPRVKMPQLAGVPLPGSKADALPKDAKGRADLGTLFKQHLADMGHSIVDDTVDASHLRASQDQLDGARVARAYERVLAGEMPPPTFISKDDYIVDGHHRWAGAVGAKYTGTRAHAMPLKVERVDMGIVPLLKEARRFGKEWGMPQVAKFNPNHDELGRFDSGSGGDLPFKPMLTDTPPRGPIVFHGTSEKMLKSIQEKGLVPQGGTGADTWLRGQKWSVDIAGRPASVYFAGDPSTAQRFAELAAETTGSTPVVLPIHLTNDKAAQMVWDEQASRPAHMRLPDSIPPNMIGTPAVGIKSIDKLTRFYQSNWEDLALGEDQTSAGMRPSETLLPATVGMNTVDRIMRGTYKVIGKRLIYAVILFDPEVKAEKFNPNHDPQTGEFTSGGSSGLDTAISSALKDKGGFTFNPVTVKAPQHGYAVGGYGTRDAYDAKSFVLNNVKEYLAKNRAAIDDGNFLGGWIDKGKVYLDVTKVFPETQREAAIAAGREHDQIAIADLSALNTGHMDRAFIDTGGTGKAEPGKRTMFLLDPRQMSEEEIHGALAEMIKQATT